MVKATDAGPLNCIFDVKNKEKCHTKHNICEKLLSCQKITKFPAIIVDIGRIQFHPTTTNAIIGPATFYGLLMLRIIILQSQGNTLSVIVLFSDP